MASKIQPIDLIDELDKQAFKVTDKTVTDDDRKAYLVNKLTQLFKRDVLMGTVYTLPVLKVLYKDHLGGDPDTIDLYID